MYRMCIGLLTTATLAACGGGSGGFNGTTPVDLANLKIDNTNGVAATKLAYQSANTNVGLGNMMSDNGPVAAGPADVSKAVHGQASKVVDITIQSVPVGPETTPCLVNGSITVSGDIASATTLTAGDTFRIVANQCDDGLDQVVHGQLDFTVTSFDGDLITSGLYYLQMSMLMTNFQVITPTDTITSNGDTTVALDTTLAPQVSASASGNSITVDSNASSETLSNFASQQTVDAGISPAPYTWSAYGTLDSTQLPGALSYTTPVTFEGEDVDFPSTGELLVEGDASSARLIAVSNVDVVIEFDYDGDGTVDEIIETTWVDLTS